MLPQTGEGKKFHRKDHLWPAEINNLTEHLFAAQRKRKI
jgi:hypothetical protein